MRSRSLLLALVVVGCGSTPPAEPICTAIGCTDGLTVRVTPTASWPHGDYRFTIEADGVTTTCTGTLPLAGCNTPSIRCEGPPVSVTESGCALPAAEHAFGDLILTSTPRWVTVDVALGEGAIARESWTPEYQTSQPNGPDCEPTCTNATVQLPLTFE